jgi:hypothetical protein
MPTHSYGTINRIDSTTSYSKGSSDSQRLSSAFPGTPTMSNDELLALFQSEVMDGKVSNGFCFSTFDRDYTDAPDINAVDAGSLNLPSGYVPNPSSPGEGSVNPADKPAPPDGFGQEPTDNWGSGVGSKLQPAQSSAIHSTMVPKTYILGKGPGATG